MENIRSLRRQLQEKNEEISFLRECLWLAQGGKIEVPKIKITVMPFEEVAKSSVDSFVKSLLTDS